MAGEVPLGDAPNQLCDLWRCGELCDVTLRAREALQPQGAGECVNAHKVVLSCYSPFFRALFSGAGTAMREGGKGIVDVDVDGENLIAIVSALYSGRLSFQSHAHAASLLRDSNKLTLECLCKACDEWLGETMSTSNALGTLQVAVTYGRRWLRKVATKFVCSKAIEFHAEVDPEGFRSLSCDALLALLADSHEHSPAAFAGQGLARALIEWSRNNGTEMNADVLREALPLRMEERAIETLLASPEFGNDNACRNLLLGALDLSGQGEGTKACKTHQLLIAAGGHERGWREVNLTEVMDLKSGEWSQGPNMDVAMSFLSAVEVESGSVIVFGGTSFREHVSRLSRATNGGLFWEPINAPMRYVRAFPGACSINDQAFVYGGRHGVNQDLSSVEVLRAASELKRGEWESFNSMRRARSSLASAALCGSAYALGGQAGKKVFSSVECMPFSREEWHELSCSLNTPRKYAAASSAGGSIFVVGGMDSQRRRLATVERFDPREGFFEPVAPMGRARSSLGLANIGECLFAAGGNNDQDVNGSVEIFDPRAGRWRESSSLSVPRAGLALFAV